MSKRRGVYSVSLTGYLIDIVENYIDDFSKFVQECIKEKFTEESLKNELNIYSNKIKKIEEQLEGIKKNKFNLIPEKVKFLKEAKEIIKKNPDYFNGQFEKYKNTFKERINLNAFKELLNENSKINL